MQIPSVFGSKTLNILFRRLVRTENVRPVFLPGCQGLLESRIPASSRRVSAPGAFSPGSSPRARDELCASMPRGWDFVQGFQPFGR